MAVKERVRNFPVINNDVIDTDRQNRTWRDLDNWLCAHGSSLRQFYLATVGLTPTTEMKAKLIELARTGAPRPSKSAEWEAWIGHQDDAYRIRQFFHRIISRRMRRQYYDADLTAELRDLRPDWFLDPVAEKKAKIRQLAEQSGPRPKGALANCFLNYCIRVTASGYDAAFSTEMRALRPDWFIASATLKKQELLAAAQAGEPKPSFQADKKRAAMFRLYVTPGSKVYDEAFTAQMVTLRPDWVFSVTHRQVDKLFELAKAGAPRPIAAHTAPDSEESLLARALIQLTRRDRVDQRVGDQLRKLAPRWFDESYVGVEKRRRQLQSQIEAHELSIWRSSRYAPLAESKASDHEEEEGQEGHQARAGGGRAVEEQEAERSVL